MTMEGITRADYKDFEIQNLSEYHDLYVQSDNLVFTDIFESFRSKSVEIYELDVCMYLIFIYSR